MKRLFNRGKWLWLESTNPLIMSYMNEKKNTSNLIASEITSTWFFLLLIKIFVCPIYLGIKGLYVFMKIFFPFYKSYRIWNFPISLFVFQLFAMKDEINISVNQI